MDKLNFNGILCKYLWKRIFGEVFAEGTLKISKLNYCDGSSFWTDKRLSGDINNFPLGFCFFPELKSLGNDAPDKKGKGNRKCQNRPQTHESFGANR